MKNLTKVEKFFLAALVLAAGSVLAGHLLAAHGVVLAAAFLGWPDANLSGTPVKRGDPSKIAGAQDYEILQPWVKATTDGSGTIYYLANLPADAVVSAIELLNDALAGATSADIGVYRLNRDGTVANTAAGAGAASGGAKSDGSDGGAIFASAVDISGGNAAGSKKDMLTTLSIANRGVKLWTVLGFTDPKLKDDRYILGLRLNTAGAATGNLAVRVSYAQG